MDKLTSLAQSRRFWIAVLGLAAVLANEIWSLGLDEEEIGAIVLLIVGWIVGDSIKSTEVKK